MLLAQRMSVDLPMLNNKRSAVPSGQCRAAREMALGLFVHI
jgi:hypothetical protein